MNFSSMEQPTTIPEAEPATQGAASLIDHDSTVEGTVTTSRDLRVEGKLHGQINCDGVLVVAEGAEVDAEIDAASIVVSGSMSGTIRCRGRLEIRSTGVVRGNVTTGALVIVEGAQYEGQISMEPSAELPREPASSTPAEPPTRPERPDSDTYSFLRRFSSSDAESSDAIDEETTDNEDSGGDTRRSGEEE